MSTYINETMSNAPSTVVGRPKASGYRFPNHVGNLGFPNIYHAFRVLDNF